MDTFATIVGTVILAILAVALIAIVFGLITCWLWNYVAPVWWAAAPHLNVWQAIATTWLLGIFGYLVFKPSISTTTK